MKFILEGEPIPQCRHRTFRRNGKNVNYDPNASHKNYVKMQMGRIVMNDPYLPYKDFYYVSLIFWFSIPKSDSKAKRKAKLGGLIQHTSKPDLDNLEKGVLDSMSGVLFSDDRKVVKLQSEKRWAEKGYTEIEINGFNHEKSDG
jgi:Holliday junction resolvase RusA-like endonuclease